MQICNHPAVFDLNIKKLTVHFKYCLSAYFDEIYFQQSLIIQLAFFSKFIKMEIKQTQLIFLCLYFYPVFSRDSLTTFVLQKYVVKKLHMYIIFR